MVSYLGDYVNNVKFTQDARRTLYVSIYHKGKQVEHSPYSPSLVTASHFRMALNDLPTDITVNGMHNETRYTQIDNFCPDQPGSVITHYIFYRIIFGI